MKCQECKSGSLQTGSSSAFKKNKNRIPTLLLHHFREGRKEFIERRQRERERERGRREETKTPQPISSSKPKKILLSSQSKTQLPHTHTHTHTQEIVEYMLLNMFLFDTLPKQNKTKINQT
jgi:hypothetical protein